MKKTKPITRNTNIAKLDRYSLKGRENSTAVGLYAVVDIYSMLMKGNKCNKVGSTKDTSHSKEKQRPSATITKIF